MWGTGTARAACPGKLRFTALGCFSPGFQSSQTCRLTAPGKARPVPVPPHRTAWPAGGVSPQGKKKGTHITGTCQSAPHPQQGPQVLFILPIVTDPTTNPDNEGDQGRSSRAITSSPQKYFTKQPATLICPGKQKQLWACARLSFILRYQ